MGSYSKKLVKFARELILTQGMEISHDLGDEEFAEVTAILESLAEDVQSLMKSGEREILVFQNLVQGYMSLIPPEYYTYNSEAECNTSEKDGSFLPPEEVMTIGQMVDYELRGSTVIPLSDAYTM